MPSLTPLPLTPLPLTDRLLRSWLRCRRRAWLDRFGAPEERQWNAHRALALNDQLRSFQTLLPNRPGHGEAACAAGVVGIETQHARVRHFLRLAFIRQGVGSVHVPSIESVSFYATALAGFTSLTRKK